YHFHTREVLAQAIFQSIAAVGEPDPAVGSIHTDVPGGHAEQRRELLQGVEPREVARRHRLGFLVGPRPLGAGVADHPDVGHATLGWPGSRALLADAGR